MILWAKLKSFFRKRKLDAEMAAEMQGHLERRIEANLASGMSASEAAHAARRAFGGVDQLKEIAREQRTWPWFEHLVRDLRFAVRQLGKSPGFTAVAVLTLALGMGANTTFFSVLRGVVLRNVPYPRPDELVEITNLGNALGNNGGRISMAELRDYRERQRRFVGIGAYTVGRVTLSREDGAERVVQTSVTANLFPLLGVAPAQGRGFTADEERAGVGRLVVISDTFWRSNFNGAADVLSRTVRLNGAEHTIVGVMPAGFSCGDRDTAIWKPLDLASRGPGDREDRSLSTIARVSPGTSWMEARADLQRVARELQADWPQAYPAEAHWNLELTPLRESQFGHLRTPLGALMAAASAVLLIACVNVAIMFLLRAAVRRREMTIRIALGASRGHLIWQSLAESAVISLLGMVGGWLVAVVGVQMLKTFPPVDIPRLQEVTIDGPVAIFMTGVMLTVTLVVGLAPAFAALKLRTEGGLAQSNRTTEARAAVGLRETLTAVEIALAVMLLVCGSLAVRSLQGLLRDDLGFETARLFTFKTNLTEPAYPDLAKTNRFYAQLTAELETLPGVAAVAAVSYLPLAGESQFQAAEPERSATIRAGGSGPPVVAWRVVRGPYFSVMGSRLLGGRFFNDADQAGGALVVVVDDEFVRRFWSEPAAALGQPVRFGNGRNAETRTIIGVVQHVKHAGPGKASMAEAYVPHGQFYQRGMYTVVKTNSGATNLAALVRARLAKIDPAVPMYFNETMEQRYAAVLALPRFTAGLIGAFSTLALVLAGVGIFGVTAYSVTQRSREFGVRFALGAPRAHVAGLVLGRVTRLALLGGAVGALAGYALARLMTGLLFGVAPADVTSVIVAAALTAVMAIVASLIPLVRALRVNPAEALRAE